MSAHSVRIGLWAWALAGTAVAAGPTLVCTQPAVNCQLPDQLGHGAGNAVGALSDANPLAGLVVRDNFQLDDGGIIDTVCWTGLYLLNDSPQMDCGPGTVADNFTITYYGNDEGIPPSPGPLVGGPFNVTASVVKSATGNVVPSAFGDLTEYEYTATHPIVLVGVGQCIWIEIRNDTTGSSPTCLWLWSTAPSFAEGGIGDGLSWQNSNQRDFDLAFCLNVALGDPAECELIINKGCVGAINPCDQTSPDPGCSDPECCSLVCAQLPQCCLIAWDESCVLAATSICGSCGELGSGNCYIANLTPSCDDECDADSCVGCCQLVCSIDPFCCDTEWDGLCVFEAQQLCPCVQGGQPPVNDECRDSILITLGDTPIDNTCATAGPPNHADCNDGVTGGLGLDIWYSYTADFTGELLVSTCGQVSYDTQLAVYEGCDCLSLSDPPLACNNDGVGCSGGSSFVVTDVVLGNCYMIRLGSSSLPPVGSGTLTLSMTPPEICDISPFPPGAIAEGEACGDDTNGGCDNIGAPTFTTVQLGDIIHGTVWADAGQNDSDWFELVLAQETEVTLTIEAEFPFLAGFAETVPPGSGNCADWMGFISPVVLGNTCDTAMLTVTLGPGTWWPFVGPLIADGLPCQEGIAADNDYVLSISSMQVCPWDCGGDNDGDVGIVDFLALLAEWGLIGTPCDFDGTGVGIVDFLDLLANWGPCP
jgi:hypothetical protein